MNKPFPIYDLCLSQASDHANPDASKICSTINNLSDDHMEVIFAMILHHFFLEQGGKVITRKTTPFSGKHLLHGTKGLIYTFSSLPPDLRKIISAYVSMVAS